MLATLRVPAAVIFGTFVLAGCSGSGLDLFNSSSSSDVTTSSLAQTQAQKVDPACGSLALEIDTLRREGVAEKVEKASAKKYKMTPVDLTKANQLNNANADFQAKCSTSPRTAALPAPAATQVAPAVAAKAAKAAPKAATQSASAAASAVGAPPAVATAVAR